MSDVSVEDLQEVSRTIQGLTKARQNAEIRRDTKKERLDELRPRRIAAEQESQKEFGRDIKELPAWIKTEMEDIQAEAGKQAAALQRITGGASGL